VCERMRQRQGERGGGRQGGRKRQRPMICRANSANVRQSRLDYGLGFKVNVLKKCSAVPTSIGKRVPEVDGRYRLLIVPLFRGSSRYESLI